MLNVSHKSVIARLRLVVSHILIINEGHTGCNGDMVYLTGLIDSDVDTRLRRS